MKASQRIQQLLSEPAYRTKLAFFALLGVATILVSIFIKDDFWRDLVVQFAVTFVAVALIQILWDFLGGDPLDTRFTAIQNEIGLSKESVRTEVSKATEYFQGQFDSLKHLMVLLGDLIEGNIGIVRIWPDRKSWQVDQNAGLKAWHEWICTADIVNIASHTLWNNWMHDSKLRKRLFRNIIRGAQVRVLMYDPDSDLVQSRAEDENDPGRRPHACGYLSIRQKWRIFADLSTARASIRLFCYFYRTV